MVLPLGAVNLEVGEGDVSPDAVRRHGDTLAVFAPVPPGPDGVKQVVVSYLAPRARLLDLPVDQPYDRFQVLLEDTLATVQALGLQRTGVETVESIAFARFDGSVAPPRPVRIVFAAGAVRPVDYWWVVVTAVALSFVVGLIAWWRRPRATPATVVVGVDELAARIAALDEAFEQRGEQATDVERARYHRERGQLKAQLAAGLGGNESRES